MHGYGIIQEVARNSDGHYRLGPGTLYDNLKKLMDAGWVADAPSQKRKSTKDDDRALFYLHQERAGHSGYRSGPAAKRHK